jgi:hypothetical protein
VTQLDQLLQHLCDAEIDFVIVGGFAGILHGSSLVTRDLDVCTILTGESVAKLREALRELKPMHRMTSPKRSFLEHTDQDDTHENLYLQTELGPVDLLSSITGVGDYARVREASIEMELFGRRCRVISLEDLIRAKEALGREKDRLAAKELRAIAEKQKS